MERPLTSDQIENIHSIVKMISNFQTEFKIQQSQFLNLLEDYKRILLKLLEMPENYISSYGENYERKHILPDGNEVTFHWSIESLDRLISTDKKVIRQKIEIGPLTEWIDFSNISPERLQYALLNNKPVSVIDYVPSNLKILIDGNHRVAARWNKTNNPYLLISSNFIPSKVHIKALNSDFQRMLYKKYA